MTILYIILGILGILFIRKILNWGGFLGLIIGGFLGSGFGIAGGGDASKGTLIIACIGFIIGGLAVASSSKD